MHGKSPISIHFKLSATNLILGILVCASIASIGLLIHKSSSQKQRFNSSTSSIKYSDSKVDASQLSETVGIFSNYLYDWRRPDKGKVIILLHDFSTGKNQQLLEFEPVYGKGPQDAFIKNKFLYIDKGHLRLLEIFTGSNLTVANLADQFAFSPDGKEIFYSLIGKEGNNIYRYNIKTQESKPILQNWKDQIDSILGSNSTKTSIFFTSHNVLYEVQEGSSPKIVYQDTEIASDQGIRYILSRDGSKILISTFTKAPPTIEKFGILDVSSKMYNSLFEYFAPPYLKLPKADDVDGFTDNSNDISGITHEGYGVYTYWTFNVTKKKLNKLFTTNKGLVTTSTPDKKHFFVIKDEYPNNKGKTTFFIEPNSNLYKPYVIESEKADGIGPNVYFVGWLKK